MWLAWLLLSLAIIGEVAGTLAIGFSQGLVKRPLLAVSAIIPGYSISLTCLILIMRWELMNLTVVYAAWVALGVALTGLVSGFMGEPMPSLKVVLLIIVVSSTIGLVLADVH